jgi:hypothetical protein
LLVLMMSANAQAKRKRTHYSCDSSQGSEHACHRVRVKKLSQARYTTTNPSVHPCQAQHRLFDHSRHTVQGSPAKRHASGAASDSSVVQAASIARGRDLLQELASFIQHGHSAFAGRKGTIPFTVTVMAIATSRQAAATLVGGDCQFGNSKDECDEGAFLDLLLDRWRAFGGQCVDWSDDQKKLAKKIREMWLNMQERFLPSQ